MEDREIISSVKAVMTRVHTFGVNREIVRHLFVCLFLLRFMRDEVEGFAEYSNDEESLNLVGKLNLLFSSEISINNIERVIEDCLHSLKYGLNIQALREVEVSSKHQLFKDKRVVMEALFWFKNWGGLLPGGRKDCSRLFEVLLNETKSPQTSQFSSSKLLSQLVVAFAAPKSGEEVLDPCVGEGGFLIEAQKTIESANSDFFYDTSFIGYDLSEEALLISTVRLLLSGANNFHLTRKSGFLDVYNSVHQKQFDVVLAQPPAGVKRNDYRQMAYERNFPVITNDISGMFIQQALLSLKNNGRAVIAVPEGILFGQNKAQVELRRFLVEHGYIQGIVRVPPRVLVQDSGIRGALLLLNKGRKTRKVRFADLTTYIESSRSRPSQFLPAVILNEIVDRMFCDKLPEARPLPSGMKEGIPGTGVSTRAFWDVSYEEIASNNWDLTPHRVLDDALTSLLKDISQLIGDEVKVENLPKVAQINTGRTIRAIDLLDTETPFGYIRIRDVANYRVGQPTKWLSDELAITHLKHQLTKNSILLSKTGTIGKLALIDKKSERFFAGSNFFVLRVNQAKALPEYLLYYLATSFCQDWLDSRKRGAVQQHINVDVIKSLPILLPSLEMQKRAVAQFRQQGTDVITFLKESSQQSRRSDIENLIDTMELAVDQLVGNDLTVEKSAYSVSEIASKALNVKEAIEELQSQKKDWYPRVLKILRLLKDIHKIPPGPVLLNMLQDAGEQIFGLINSTPGNYNQEERVVLVFGKLKARIERTIDKILSHVAVLVKTSIAELQSDSDVEFTVTVENQSFLPLKNVVVETSPDYGSDENYYLADHGEMDVPLSCRTPDSDSISFKVTWRAETLAGKQVDGSSEIAIKLTSDGTKFKSLATASNPYVTGSPLEPDNGALVFYGRDSLLKQIVRQVEDNGNVILLEGNRRAGKTSILKHLEGSETIPNWLAVYSSLQGAEGASDKVGVPTAEVFREMARSIASALTKLRLDVPLPDGKVIIAGKTPLGIARSCKAGISEDSPFIDFRDYLEVLLTLLEQKRLGIVLMLDEFDKLQEGIDNGVTSPQLPENIRYLIQNYPKFSAILTGSRRLKRLREEYWSALYGLGTNLTVSALDRENAVKVVIEPVKDYIAYSNEAIDLILDLTAKQPYLIQKVCNRIFDYAARNTIHSIKTSDVLLIADELVKADEHFASLWDYAKLGPVSGGYRRLCLLYTLACNFDNQTLCTYGMLQEELTQRGIRISDDELDTDIAYLRELELVKFCGELGSGHYTLEVPLMAKWISHHQDNEVIFKNATNAEGPTNDY
ncbi:N-6 DNA methylase [Alteromonas gracilis]|uniref:N-6 DNA methylase n=1 Tax=Alteromonas gracilis TaxID=1479524 RepID=UPI0030CEC96A